MQTNSYLKFLLSLILLSFSLCWNASSTDARGQRSRQLFNTIRAAKQKLIKADFDACEKLLRSADTIYNTIQKKLPSYDRRFFRLSLYRLWYEFHKFRGKAPKILVNMQKQKDLLEVLDDRTQHVQSSIEDFNKALSYIQKHNRILYKVVMEHSRLRDQLRLVNAQALARDVQGEVKLLQLRLQYLRMYKKRVSQTSKKAKPEVPQELVQKKIVPTVQEQKLVKVKLIKERKKVVASLIQTQTSYEEAQGKLDKKEAHAKRLTTTGLIVGGTAVGIAAVIGGGVGLALHVLQNDTSLDAATAQEFSNASTGLFIGSGALAAAGLGVLIAGLVMRPKSFDRNKVLLRSLQMGPKTSAKQPTSMLQTPPLAPSSQAKTFLVVH